MPANLVQDASLVGVFARQGVVGSDHNVRVFDDIEIHLPPWAVVPDNLERAIEMPKLVSMRGQD